MTLQLGLKLQAALRVTQVVSVALAEPTANAVVLVQLVGILNPLLQLAPRQTIVFLVLLAIIPPKDSLSASRVSWENTLTR